MVARTHFGIAVTTLTLVCTATFTADAPAHDAPTISPEETPLAPQAVQFLRGITLLLLPETYTDDDDWAGEKRIQSGLNVDLDGIQVRTSRRWKNVNHGIWRRVDATLVDPKEFFQLGVSLLPRTDPDVPRYRVHAAMRLRAVGRQQQWSLGAKLYSLSADATADVDIDADVQFESKLVATEEGTKLQVLPVIETASIRLRGYRLNGISHAKGSAIRELGRAMEPIIQRAIRKKNGKLTAKINSRIQKKPEKFRIPASILAFLKKKEAATLEEELTATKPPDRLADRSTPLQNTSE